jgi:beta-mannanase
MPTTSPRRTSWALGVCVGLVAAIVPLQPTTALPVASIDEPSRTSDAGLRSIAIGVSMWDGRQMSVLDGFTASIGRTPATWTIWSQWGGSSTRAFPTAAAKGAKSRGATPMIWWEPWDPSDPESPTYARHANITSGLHDDYIRQFARDARAFRSPVIIRFAHEGNGRTFPWGRESFDNTPASYVEAWRHVHRMFRTEGADNALFLWSVATQPCPGGCNPYAAYYPGDLYVDYMGFSSFNWAGQENEWVPMLQGFRRVTELLSEIAPKPIMAVESASNPEGGDKIAWIKEGYPAVHAALPAIVAIAYLNVDLRSIGDPDWRLTSPPAALEAYADIAAMPEFQGRLPGT